MLKPFEAARRAGAPIVAIATADPAATIATLLPAVYAMNAKSTETPAAQWDAARGITALNKTGQAALAKAGIKLDETVGFVEAMLAAQLFPEAGMLLFAHHAHRQLQSQEPAQTAAAMQAVANIRDQFKKNFRMLVFVGPEFTVPRELEFDVVKMTHDLPTASELSTIVTDLHGAVPTLRGKPPTPAVMEKAVDALSGLNHFAAETATAMSLTESGIDLDGLNERRRLTIEQADGLSVYRGKETFDDLRGLDSVKARLRQHVHAQTPVGVVVWVDEGADVFSNVETDTSGVKTDQQRALLVDMEQYSWRGMIAVGVPGSGKSALARAFGNEAGVPTIQVDFGAMESKYVGESEGKLRQALSVIKAVGRGHAFFILTANSLRGIRPQFQARFRRGVFFFDLPTADERDAIWRLYLKKYGLVESPANPRPNDDGWVGREIRECCESAWDCGVSLADAARYIVPVSRSRGQEIEQMRREANGRFLDASKPGPYKYDEEPMQVSVRAIALPPTSKQIN